MSRLLFLCISSSTSWKCNYHFGVQILEGNVGVSVCVMLSISFGKGKEWSSQEHFIGSVLDDLDLEIKVVGSNFHFEIMNETDHLIR